MKLGIFYHHVREAAKAEGVSIGEMLDYVKSLGIDYLEMDMDNASDIEGTASLVKEHGFTASNICVMYPWQKDASEMLEGVQIRMAKAFGADKIMPIPGLYTGEDSEKVKELDRMIDGMSALSDKAKEVGLSICIEDYDNALSPIASMEGMKFFCDYVPDLKVAFDTGNFEFYCEDAWEAYELLKDKIIHVHLKDRAQKKVTEGHPKEKLDHSFMYPCAVGDGDIPVAKIVKDLLRSGYDGIFTIEHYDVEDYKTAITRSVAYLKTLESEI